MTLATDRAIVRAPARADFVINLFGSFSVVCDDRPLPKMRTRKDLWLLALLTLHAMDRPIERAWLASTLWPETSESGALYNLRRSLGALRDALGPQAERIVSPSARTLHLDLTTGADCDLLRFDDAVRRGDEKSLEAAAGFYRGPLLLGCLEEWVWEPRAARQRALLSALETLAQKAEARGDQSQAGERLRQVLDHDPLRESALRSLMTLLMAQGSHAAAAELFRQFRESLRKQSNAEPSPETAQVNRQVLREMRASARVTLAPAADEPTHADAGASASRPSDAFLPIGRSDLVGREAARGAVRALLKDHRLVTLVGTGGVGKTRLAFSVIDSLIREFADGVWFVDLTSISEASSLAPVIAHALGLDQSADVDASLLAAHLAPRRMLIVLDNCEHLVEACFGLVARLLQDCEHIRILATSRERLWADGEVVWRVPSLAPPDSVALFIQRAAQSRPSFQPTADMTEVIARICHRLDGIPLAIEMAAAWMRAITASQIAERLDDAFRLLARNDGETTPRHQTLRATLDWSYNLLTGPEQTLLARLSFFAGGWTLEAAEAVCPASNILDAADILETLVALVDRSLVVYREDSRGEGRYHFLETTRVYAAEKLPPSEQAPLRAALIKYLTQLAETAKTAWGGAEESLWLDRLEAELPNIRVALATTSDSDEDGKVSRLRLPTTLFRLWWHRAHLTEGRAFLTAALDDCEFLGQTESIAAALNARGSLANMQRDTSQALADHASALTIRRALDDRRGIAVSLHNLAAVHQHLGHLVEAIDAVTECVSLYRALGDEVRASTNEKILAGLLAAYGVTNTGVIPYTENDLEAAVQRGDRGEQGGICATLAIQAHQNERFAESITWWKRALTLRVANHNPARIAEVLEGIAKTSLGLGDCALFARLLGAAARLREQIHSPSIAVNRFFLDKDIAHARSLIGDEAFDAAWNEGLVLSTEDAVACALAV